MSDTHIYELEDIVWDDFSASDGHLAPHPEFEQVKGGTVQTESHKKLKYEVGKMSITGSHVAKHGVSTGKYSFSSPNTKSEPVPANGSWSHNPDAFQTYDDLMTSLPFEGQVTTSHDVTSNNNLFTADPTPATNCTAADKNISYSYDAPQSESGPSFLYNGDDNKETVDPLFYEWPEIENFEDVDHMLRTCDTPFGLGDSTKHDEMCWFSSSDAINGTDAASKTEIKSSYSDSNSIKIFSEKSESPQRSYESPAVDFFNKRRAGASYGSSTLPSFSREQSCLSKVSSLNERPMNSNNMDKEERLKEVIMRKGKVEHQMQSIVPLHQYENSKPPPNTQHCSLELLSMNCRGPQKQKVEVVTNSNPVSARTEINNSGNEEGTLTEISQLDEGSLEETSFRQLRDVIEQLNLKTKLCIRDSLYRLARSAEQRHDAGTTIRVTMADTITIEPLTAETKCAGLLDIETDTNPIDRTIAHLLFHRPSDPSNKPLSNTQPDSWMSRHDESKDTKLPMF